jgi:predicted small secreted protein
MKKAILILGAALTFVVAGCNQEQGGTSDTYSTGSGTNNASSKRNAPTAPSSTDTNQVQTPRSTQP